MKEAKRLRRGNLRRKESALRGFLGFLKLTGGSKKDYRTWLTNYRTWRLSRLPKMISGDELDRLFNDMRRDRPSDLRDRAIFVLLTLYGTYRAQGLTPAEARRRAVEDAVERLGHSRNRKDVAAAYLSRKGA